MTALLFRDPVDLYDLLRAQSRRVGEANGSRECARGDVPTIVPRLKGWARRKARAFARPCVAAKAA